MTGVCSGYWASGCGFKAIRMTVPASESYKLLEYTVSSVTAGIDALADVTTRVQDEESLRVAVGRSANTDVIVASAQSYINAINRLVLSRGQNLLYILSTEEPEPFNMN